MRHPAAIGGSPDQKLELLRFLFSPETMAREIFKVDQGLARRCRSEDALLLPCIKRHPRPEIVDAPRAANAPKRRQPAYDDRRVRLNGMRLVGHGQIAGRTVRRRLLAR